MARFNVGNIHLSPFHGCFIGQDVVIEEFLDMGADLTPNQNEDDPNYCVKTTNEKHRSIHQVHSTSASVEADQSAVTSIEGDDDSTFYSTAGSTAFGDSFVVAIDWDTNDEYTTGGDGSFSDPYLESSDAIMKRMVNAREKENPSTPVRLPRLPNKQQPSSPEFPHTSPRVPASGHTGSNIKSLGAFEWPDDEENARPRPLFSIAVPPIRHTGPMEISNIEVCDESSVENSFSATPLSIQPPDVLIGRKKVPLDEETVQQLREQLDGEKPNSIRSARMYLRLGQTEQKLHRYVNAIHSFLQAASVFRRFSRKVALANVLDKVGVAYCEAQRRGAAESLKDLYAVPFFSQCLVEALDLRKQELGPWHVDTVDTLQHLALLCLTLGHPTKAASHYLEVVNLRKAIFGPNHPSTAVTAHCLGKAYLQSHDTLAAEVWFEYALNIYNELGIPHDNPAVAKLLRDRQRRTLDS